MTTVAELRIDVGVNDLGSDAKLRRVESAVEGVEKSADGAARATGKAGRNIKGMGDKAQRSSKNMGALSKASLSVARAAGTAAGAFTGLAAAAATFGSIRIGAGFEEQMSAVLAITGATQEQFEGLSATARELGASTVFSAKQAAEGMEFLARAGFDANEIVGALPGTLNLAAAGALELGRAADIASNVLTGFGLATSEANRVADVLAKAAASSNTNVEQLGEAMKFVAPIAAGLGVSIETATAAVGKLSDAGLQASTAGTGLRRVLSELAAPSQKLTELLGETSLEADGFESVMKQLASQTISTGEALEIFGDRGGPAFTVLIEQFKNLDSEGVSSLEKLSQSLEKASGFAEDTAKTMTDNFAGAVKQAKSALEELFIVAAVDGGALEGLTAGVEALTTALRSDAAAEFAKGFGEGMRDATFFVLGLVDAISQIEQKLAPVIGLLERLESFSYLVVNNSGAVKFNPVGSSIDGIGGLFDELSERGRVLSTTDPVAEKAVTSINALQEAIAGTTPVAEHANKTLSQLQAVIGKVDEESTGAASGISKTAAALEKQLDNARRLQDAAKIGGQASLDIVQETLEIEALTDDLFKRAQEAGDSVTKAQIATLLQNISDAEKATDKLLEAEEKLQDRLSDARTGIADGLQGSLDSFVRDVGRVDFADPRNAGALAAFEERLGVLLSDFEVESIGLDPKDVAEFEKKFGELAKLLGDSFKEDAKEAADYFKESIQFGIGDALDDIIFNAGRGLGDILDRSIRGAVNNNFIDPISRAFTGDGGIFGNIKGAFQKQLDGFQNAFGKTLGSIGSAAFSGLQGFEIGKGLADALGIRGNQSSQVAGGVAGGGVGAVGGFLLGGPLGAAIGASIGSALGNIFGGLFSKPSDNTAQAVFRPQDGFIAGRGQDGAASNENAQARDAILESITEVTRPIADLLGSFSGNPSNTAPNEAFLNLAVRSDRKTREQFIQLGYQGPNGEPFNAQRFAATEAGALQAVEEGIRLSILAFRGGDQTLREFAQSAVRANRPIEEIIQVLDVLDGAVSSGRDELAQYATAAAKAGRSGEQIVEGLNAFDAALSRTAEPISAVEQELRSVSEAFAPVIADLRSLGQSTSEISRLERTAFRSVGENFIQGLRDASLQATNSVVASYADLLKQIAQQNKDAAKLLDAGAITQNEFAFAQSVGGQQISGFLSGLSDDDRASLGNFLGVMRETAGDIAVARVELEEQFSFLIDGVSETVAGYEEAARTFQRITDGLSNTASRIRAEFGEGNPRQEAQDLTGELTRLRNEALGGSQQALNAIGAVATSLVQSARQAFGGTTAFGDIRDFALSVLDETSAFAQGLANENSLAAEAAKNDVDLLRDIKGLLSDDRQISTLQNILDEGRLTNKLIETQLGAFVSLFNQDGTAANPITDQELQTALDRYLASLPANDNAGNGIVEAAQQQVSNQQENQAAQSNQNNGQQNAAASNRQSDLTATQESAKNFAELATAIDRNTDAVQRVYFTNEDLTDEIRRDRVARNN